MTIMAELFASYRYDDAIFHNSSKVAVALAPAVRPVLKGPAAVMDQAAPKPRPVSAVHPAKARADKVHLFRAAVTLARDNPAHFHPAVPAASNKAARRILGSARAVRRVQQTPQDQWANREFLEVKVLSVPPMSADQAQ